MFQQFTFARAMHAPLFKRYSMQARCHVTVGDVEGKFGREDSATGAEYKALGSGKNDRGRVTYSGDLECGSYYPETVFLWGIDENGAPLPHEACEAFAQKLGYTAHKRCLLPKGYEKGRATWDCALCFCPPERKPDWQHLAALIKAKFPQADLWPSGDYVLEVNLENQ